MYLIPDILSLNHHATLLLHSDRKEVASSLWNKVQPLSLAHKLYDQTILDIDTAREIISWANASYELEKIAIVSFHSITIPAQNALLKILEEPKPTIKFILVTSDKEGLLPTLFSRLQTHTLSTKKDPTSFLLAREFLTTKPSERMKLPGVVALLQITDEKDRKDREKINNFIIEMTQVLNEMKNYPNETLEVLRIASYAKTPSSSGKMLLEYLSLFLPEITG